MARLQEEGAETDCLIGFQTGETRASDLGRSLQAFLTNLILLVGMGQFSRGEWAPALIVLAIYVVTLVGVFCNNADR
jgi:hypothetical protein